jgi:hypothetical protein
MKRPEDALQVSGSNEVALFLGLSCPPLPLSAQATQRSAVASGHGGGKGVEGVKAVWEERCRFVAIRNARVETCASSSLFYGTELSGETGH